MNETQAFSDALLTALCPIRYSLDIVGGKWKLPILCILSTGLPTRNNVIKRKLPGITNMMLSQSLKDLAENGIIHRKQYNVMPPKVEYTLTEEGKTLLPALELLAQWGGNHMNENHAGPPPCAQCQAQTS